MTEPHLRDLFAWLDAHRRDLIDHAGSTAEIAAMLRRIDLRNDNETDHAANRLQVLSMAIAAALSELERVYPLDVLEDEDTAVDGLPLPPIDPDADTKPDIVPAGVRRRLTGRPA